MPSADISCSCGAEYVHDPSDEKEGELFICPDCGRELRQVAGGDDE